MISFLHTSAVHVATFDGLLDQLSPGMARQHRVEDAWLARAREQGMTPDLAAEVTGTMRDLAAGGVGVCTCSTIGGVAEAAGTDADPVIRIDRALMQTALEHGPRPLVAMCLESTRAPTLGLLDDVAASAGCDASPMVVMCTDAWRHFEAENSDAYAASIAGTISSAIAADTPDCIVLAQASMAPAEPLLDETGLPVLTSPRLGVLRALQLLKERG